MKKVCEACSYEPTKEQELDPLAPTENCPVCGGVGTVVDQDSEAADTEVEG